MLKELTAEEMAKLEAKFEEEARLDDESCAKRQAVLDRLMSIISQDERDSLPMAIHCIIMEFRSWCPASRDMAITIVKKMIGSDKEERDCIAKKWQAFWDENPEIHF